MRTAWRNSFFKTRISGGPGVEVSTLIQIYDGSRSFMKGSFLWEIKPVNLWTREPIARGALGRGLPLIVMRQHESTWTVIYNFQVKCDFYPKSDKRKLKPVGDSNCANGVHALLTLTKASRLYIYNIILSHDYFCNHLGACYPSLRNVSRQFCRGGQ